MANEDALIKVGVDLSPAEKSLQSFYSKLNALQAKAERSGKGAQQSVQLPRQLAQQVVDPKLPQIARSQGTADATVTRRNKAIQDGLALQAKRVALLEQEYRLSARIAGASSGEISAGVRSIRQTGRQGLASSLGISEGQFKTQFGRIFDQQLKSFQNEFSQIFSNMTVAQQGNALRTRALPILQEVGVTAPVTSRQIRNADYGDPYAAQIAGAQQTTAASARAEAQAAQRSASATGRRAAAQEQMADAAREALAKSRAAYAKADAANLGAIDRSRRNARTAPVVRLSEGIGEAIQQPSFTGDSTVQADRTAAIRDQARLLALKEQELLINQRIASGKRDIGFDSAGVSTEIKNLRQASVFGLETQLGSLSDSERRGLGQELKKARAELEAISRVPLSEQANQLRMMAKDQEGLFAGPLAGQGITRLGQVDQARNLGRSAATAGDLRPTDVLDPGDTEARIRSVEYAIASYERAIVQAASELQIQNAGLVRELAEAVAATKLYATELEVAALAVANRKGVGPDGQPLPYGAQAALNAEREVARTEQRAQTATVLGQPDMRAQLVDARGRILRSEAAQTAEAAASAEFVDSTLEAARARDQLKTSTLRAAGAEDISAKAALKNANDDVRERTATEAEALRRLEQRQARADAVRGGDTDSRRLDNRLAVDDYRDRQAEVARAARIANEAEARNARLLQTGAVPKYDVDAPIDLVEERAIIKQQQEYLGREAAALRKQADDAEVSATLSAREIRDLRLLADLRAKMITELTNSARAAGRVAAGTAGSAPYKDSLSPYVVDNSPAAKAVKNARRQADEAELRAEAGRLLEVEKAEAARRRIRETPVVGGDATARREALAAAGYGESDQRSLRERARRDLERRQRADRQRALRLEATERNNQLLSGGSLPIYRASDTTMDVQRERDLLNQQSRQLRKEMEVEDLTDQEIQLRERLLAEMRGRLSAVSSVANGTVPRSANARRFFDDDLQGQRRDEARRARLERQALERAEARAEASRVDPGYRNRGINAARPRAEALARIQGRRSAPDYASLTDFATERQIIKTQISILEKMKQAEGLASERNRIAAQINALNEQQKSLTRAQNASMGGGGNRPPTTPGYGATGPGQGGWFSRFTSKFRSGHQYDDPSAFFGRGALSSIQYGLPSMLLYGAASGITDAVREAEELQYVFSKLEGQVASTFGPNSQQIVDDFKQTIIDTAVDAGIAADELGATSLKIFGTFSQRDIGGLEGSDLVNSQVESLGKLQRVTGLTAKQLENDYSAISIAFGRTFEQIADQVVAISDITGVDAGELGNFAGDIATVLVEAGFTLEEALALGATSAQSSGKSMGAISEAYGRVIPQLAQQTEELNKLAAGAPALQTPAFLDAVRLRDGSAILQEIGRQYNNLSKTSQTEVTALIGRREAQSVLPGLVNQQGYADALNAAENSTGRLDDRFGRVMQNLSSQLAKLGEEVRVLFKELLEGGLGDFLQLLLSAARGLVGVFGGLFSVIESINDATGGWLGNIILVAAAMAGVSKAMQAIVGLQVVQNTLSARQSGAGLINSLPSPISGAYQGYQAGRYGSQYAFRPVAGGGLGPVVPGGIPANIGTVRGGLAGAGRGLLTGIGGGSMALGAATLGVTAVAGAGLYIKSRIDDANAAVEELRAAERQYYDTELAEADTPQIRKDLSQTTLAKAEDAARRQGNLNKVLATLFNVTTEAEALKVEAIRILLDPEIEQGLEDVSTTAAGRDFLNEYFNVPKDLSTKEGDAIESELSAYANQRAAFLDTRAKIVEALKDASGARRDELQKQVEAVDRILAGETVDVGSIDSEFLSFGVSEDYNPYSTAAGSSRTSGAQSLQLPDIGDNTKLIKEALDKAGVELGTLDPKVREALVEAIRSANPGAALQEALDSGDFNEDQQKAFQEILSVIIAAASQDPDVQAAVAAKDPVGQVTDAIRDIDADYQNGLISVYEWARRKAEQANELKRLVDVGEVEDPESLAQAETEARNARDALSEVISRRLDADLKVIDRYSSGDTEVDFSAKIAALESAISTGFLNSDALDGALDDWFEAQKDALQQAIDDAETPEQKQALADAGFQIPDYIRVASIRSYLDSLGVAWTTLNDTFEEYFQMSAEAYISTVIAAVSAGETTIEAARETIAATIAFVQAALAASSNVANLAKALPIFGQGSQDAKDANAARRDALNAQLQELQAVYDALGIGDPGANQKIKLDEDQKQAANKAADAQASYRKAVANRNAVEIAQIEKAEAARKYQEAQALSGDERAAAEWAALESDVKANQALVAAVKNIFDAKVGYLRAVLEFNGDQVGSLQAEQIRIQNDIQDALNAGDEAGFFAGQEALIRNQDQQRAERGRIRDSAYGLFEAEIAGDDPVAQLKIQEALARQQLADAVGIVGKADAQKNLIDIQKQLQKAMSEARFSSFDLRQAELDAMDEDAAAARVAAEKARAQLADAIKRGAGTSEINALKAAVVSSDKAASDALVQEKLDDYKFLLDMGQITKSQYINYLEALKNTLRPGTDQFKNLELTLRQLKNDISGDLQMNLPTSLRLPTFYEVRRLEQIGGSAPTSGQAGSAGAIGYQDNRVQDIQITIGQNMTEDEIVEVMRKAIGTDRNGYGTRRY